MEPEPVTSFLLKDHLREITMMDSSAEMVKIMNEKISAAEAKNMKALHFDLEKEKWTGEKFDMLITQMVLHHVLDIDNIIRKFYNILNPGSYLAVADLYPEDGSFHGEGFTGHKGFDTNMLADILREQGFGNISARKCFEIEKKSPAEKSLKFDIFLLIAYRPNILT